mgnify:FL=1|jgi:hypothetical protein
MDTNLLIKAILDIEQERPENKYYVVNMIDIVCVKNSIIEYRVNIASKMDPKWNIWYNSLYKIKIDDLLVYVRDERINMILGN